MYLILVPIIIITLIIVYIYIKLQVPNELRHIPSKHAFKWLTQVFINTPFETRVKEMMLEQYKESKVQLDWRLGRYFVRVMSVESAKMIFNDTKMFPKLIPSGTHPDRLFSKFLGESVVFSSNEVWRKHRRVVNPPFKKQFGVKTFVDTTRQFFTILDNRDETKLDGVHKYMQRITMDCLGKDIMGVEFNSIVDPQVKFLVAYNKVIEGALNPLWFVLPWLDTESNPYRKPYFDHLHKLNGYFKDILAEKRVALKRDDVDDSKLDLLSLLIKAGQNQDNEFSDLDIQNNITTFLLAGHDTTAFALTAALHLLAEHPDIQERARKEVMEVMGYEYTETDPIRAKAPTLEETKKMNYLLAVMKETMRMYPSVSRLPDRYAAKDIEIDGYIVPKGTGVMLDIYCMHRDPNNFKDPNSFKPERFLNLEGENNKDPVSYTPFGGGTRLCLGINFSLLEQKIVLAMILCRYKLKKSQLDFGFRPLLMPNSSSLEFVPLWKVMEV